MIKTKAILLFLFFPTILLAQQHFDIIIKHGKIIDGTGNPGFMAM